MKRTFWRSVLIWISRIKYRKGYGVQSPFAYSFFRDILFERFPYYDFEKLKNISDPKLSRHTLQVMYRIVNMVSPNTILDILPLSAAPACYISGVVSKSRTISLTDKDEISKDILFRTHALDMHTEVRCGNVLKEVMEISKSSSNIDFVCIGIIENEILLSEILRVLYHKISDDGCLVIEGINRDFVKDKWKNLNLGPRQCIAFDLYDIGVIFFKNRTNKEYYKVNY